MDVIPLDARLVKGSHGRPTDRGQEGPILLGTRKDLLGAKEVYSPTEIKPLILDHF